MSRWLICGCQLEQPPYVEMVMSCFPTTMQPNQQQSTMQLLEYIQSNPLDIPNILNTVDLELTRYCKQKNYICMIAGTTLLVALIEATPTSTYNYTIRICLYKYILILLKTLHFECIQIATNYFLKFIVNLEVITDTKPLIAISMDLIDHQLTAETYSNMQHIQIRICGCFLLRKVIENKRFAYSEEHKFSFERFVSVCLFHFKNDFYSTSRTAGFFNRSNSEGTNRIEFDGSNLIQTNERELNRKEFFLKCDCIATLLQQTSTNKLLFARFVVSIITCFEKMEWNNSDELLNLFEFVGNCLLKFPDQSQQTVFDLIHVIFLYIKEILFASSNDNKLHLVDHIKVNSIDSTDFWMFPVSPFEMQLDSELIGFISSIASNRIDTHYSTSSLNNADKNDMKVVHHYKTLFELIRTTNQLYQLTKQQLQQQQEQMTAAVPITRSTGEAGSELATLYTPTAYQELDNVYTVLCLLYDAVQRSPCCRHNVHYLVDSLLVNNHAPHHQPLRSSGRKIDSNASEQHSPSKASKSISSNTDSEGVVPGTVSATEPVDDNEDNNVVRKLSSSSLKQNKFDTTRIMNNSFQLSQHKSHAKIYLEEEELLGKLFEQLWICLRIRSATISSLGGSLSPLLLAGINQFMSQSILLIKAKSKSSITTKLKCHSTDSHELSHSSHSTPHKRHSNSNSVNNNNNNNNNNASNRESTLLHQMNHLFDGIHSSASADRAAVTATTSSTANNDSNSETEQILTTLNLLILTSISAITKEWTLVTAEATAAATATTAIAPLSLSATASNTSLIASPNFLSLLLAFMSGNWDVAKIITSIINNVLYFPHRRDPVGLRGSFRPSASASVASLELSDEYSVSQIKQLLFGGSYENAPSNHFLDSNRIFSFVKGLFSSSDGSSANNEPFDDANLSHALSNLLLNESSNTNNSQRYVLSDVRDCNWAPLNYTCAVLLRDAIFNTLCTVYDDQALWTVACWEMQVSLVRRFGAQQLLQDLPMLLALETFWRVFPLESVPSERQSDCIEMLANQRLFFISYLLFIAREVIGSPMLLNLLKVIHTEWKQYKGALPTNIKLNLSTWQIEPVAAVELLVSTRSKAEAVAIAPAQSSSALEPKKERRGSGNGSNREKGEDNLVGFEGEDDDDDDVADDSKVVIRVVGAAGRSTDPLKASMMSVRGSQKSVKLLSIPSASSNADVASGADCSSEEIQRQLRMPTVEIHTLRHLFESSVAPQNLQLKAIIAKAFGTSYVAVSDLTHHFRQLDIENKQQQYLRQEEGRLQSSTDAMNAFESDSAAAAAAAASTSWYTSRDEHWKWKYRLLRTQTDNSLFEENSDETINYSYVPLAGYEELIADVMQLELPHVGMRLP